MVTKTVIVKTYREQIPRVTCTVEVTREKNNPNYRVIEISGLREDQKDIGQKIFKILQRSNFSERSAVHVNVRVALRKIFDPPERRKS